MTFSERGTDETSPQHGSEASDFESVGSETENVFEESSEAVSDTIYEMWYVVKAIS